MHGHVPLPGPWCELHYCVDYRTHGTSAPDYPFRTSSRRGCGRSPQESRQIVSGSFRRIAIAGAATDRAPRKWDKASIHLPANPTKLRLQPMKKTL